MNRLAIRARTADQHPSRFTAEAVTPLVPSRRGLLAACACCLVAGSVGLRAAPANALPTSSPLHGQLDAAAASIEARMIAWRRDIHQNP